MVILGVILADRFILGKNDQRVQHAAVISKDAPKSTLSVPGKDHSAILSLAMRDIAVLTAEVSKLEHFGGARAMYYLLLPTNQIDLAIIPPCSMMSQHLSLPKYHHGLRTYRRTFNGSPQGFPLHHIISPAYSSVPHYENAGDYLFRGPVNGHYGYGILFTPDYPDYTVFLLNITKMRVFGQLTTSFYRWLEYYLNNRITTPMLEIELMTHEPDKIKSNLIDTFVVFTSGKCVDSEDYTISCKDLAGAKMQNC